MKVRTDFHSVNLAKGEMTRSIVGDGQEVHETVATEETAQRGESREEFERDRFGTAGPLTAPPQPAGTPQAGLGARAITVLKAALRQAGCDGDLCMYEWHEEARRVITEADETVEPVQMPAVTEADREAAREWLPDDADNTEIARLTLRFAAHRRIAAPPPTGTPESEQK